MSGIRCRRPPGRTARWFEQLDGGARRSRRPSTSCPRACSTIDSISRIDRSSSTTRMRAGLAGGGRRVRVDAAAIRRSSRTSASAHWYAVSAADRQRDLDAGALALLRRHADLAAVVADDAVHDRRGRGRCRRRSRRGTAGRCRRAPPARCRRPGRPRAMTTSPARPPRRRRARPQSRSCAAVRHRAQPVGRQVPDDLPDLALVGAVPRPARPARPRRSRARSVTSALFSSSRAVSVTTCRTSTSRRPRPLRPGVRRGSCGSSRSADPTRAARCPSAATARRSAAAPARRIWIEPDIDASGLRISCAMPAAISPTAASRCCTRASRSCFRSSVTSWNVNRKPVSPRGVISGALLSPSSIWRPSPAVKPNSHAAAAAARSSRAPNRSCERRAAAAARRRSAGRRPRDAAIAGDRLGGAVERQHPPVDVGRRQAARQAVDDVLAERLQVGELIRRLARAARPARRSPSAR